MRIILLSAFALFLLLPENIQAQVTVKTGYISSSRYKDENGQEYLVHNTDHDHTFIWDNGKYIFEICSNLDKRSVLECVNPQK